MSSCPTTGLSTPECSCSACVQRLIAKHRPVLQAAPQPSKAWAEVLTAKRATNLIHP